MFRNHTDTIRTKAQEAISSCCGKKGYACDMCDTQWLTETDVEIHRKKVHLRQLLEMIESKNHYVCLICVRDQGSPEALLSHIKERHLLSSPNAHRIEREVFICDHCDHIFFNKLMLAAHIYYVHGSKEDRESFIECPKCEKYIHVKKLWFHFGVHHINILSTCQICFADCKSLSHLKDHLKTHPGHYYCNLCDYVTHRDKFFDEHIRSHKRRKVHLRKLEVRKYFVPGPFLGAWKYKHETGMKGLQVYDIFICVMCREICSTKAEMRMHIFIDHAPEKEVKRRPMCSCGEEFFNTVLLKHHIFKMKGEHRALDEEEIKALIEEDNNCAVELKQDYCNYEVIIDNSKEIIDVYPIEDKQDTQEEVDIDIE